jgi:hypothetical protein
MPKATSAAASANDDSTLDVTRETLEDTPSRVLPFLRAVGTSVPIRSILRARGFTADEQKLGWTLLHAVSGFTDEAKAETVDVRVRDAINTLDAWDEDGFRIVRAAFTRLHPAQKEFVLAGIGPSVGAGAVTGVKALLGRLDALEKGPERKATRKEDQAALATLAARGIDAKERARLADLVHAAESATETEAPDESGRAAREAVYLKALGALRVWYVDWSEMARSVVKRRDYLIRLGLAKRKSAKKPPTG